MNKKRFLISLLVIVCSINISFAQVEITSTMARSMYRNITMQHVSVHDPSIVFNSTDNYYYIFGSHRGQARTRDLQNWSHISAPWGVVDANGNVRTAQMNVTSKTTYIVLPVMFNYYIPLTLPHYIYLFTFAFSF